MHSIIAIIFFLGLIASSKARPTTPAPKGKSGPLTDSSNSESSSKDLNEKLSKKKVQKQAAGPFVNGEYQFWNKDENDKRKGEEDLPED